MKPEIHPGYADVSVKCSCGNAFTTRSTKSKDIMYLDVCANCHPFYTGKQKVADVGGRVDKFNKRYTTKSATAA